MSRRAAALAVLVVPFLALFLLGCDQALRRDPPITAAKPADLVVDLGGGVNLELVLVQAGEFIMCDPPAAHVEKVAAPYYLGRYEITEEQWWAVMKAAPRRAPGDAQGPRVPVQHLTFEDCMRFVEELSAKQPDGRFMIPTEAQWELACRAGTSTKWCCGDDDSKLAEYAWYSPEKAGKPSVVTLDVTAQPVGTKRPNGWGFFDMHGNVSEWCADPWRLFTDSLDGNGHPFYEEDTDYCVVRGGSYAESADDNRSSVRGRALRESRDRLFGVGLRVAREGPK